VNAINDSLKKKKKKTSGSDSRERCTIGLQYGTKNTCQNDIEDHKMLRDWVDDWLSPRQFMMEVDGQVLGKVTMTGGTPQGSPLSPALFTIYMSSVVGDTEERLKQRGGGRELRQERRVSCRSSMM